MKTRLLCFFTCICSLAVFAQDNTNAIPIGWNFPLDDVTTIELPILNLEDIVAEDQINDLDKTLPWRYGVVREIHLNLLESATPLELSNGSKIWRIAIQSPEALNLSVNFDRFSLPEGATLQFYNASKTDASKLYDMGSNRVSKVLGSWFVEGDTIVIEYYQPSGSSISNAELVIGNVIHGYRLGKVHQFLEGRGLEDSGDCNYDVNCSVGSDFEAKKDMVKRAVALLNLGNGKLCSASLVNNALQDKTPFLLTANHCLQDSDPALWSVRFNWMSPGPICGEVGETEDIQSNFTMSGTQLRAHNSTSDFALVQLYNPIPSSWDVVFAGWDRSDETPSYQVGIHHPNGDIMKVCRDNDPAGKDVANGTNVWLIKGTSSGNGNGWDIGTTESGSSGSPLFDDQGKIIGQLYAGLSACNGTESNADFDLYGRFAVSWEGIQAGNALKYWLDPLDTGIQQMGSMENALSIDDFEIEAQLMVFPNPASEYITILNTQYPHLSYRFYSILGQELQLGDMSNSQNLLDVRHFEEGIYFLYLFDEDSQKSITKKIIIKR